MRKDKEKKVKGYENGRRKQSGLVKPQAIQGMKEIMGTKDQTFQGTEIQDAAEFFGLLFSEVRESTAELGVLEANFVIRHSGGG